MARPVSSEMSGIVACVELGGTTCRAAVSDIHGQFDPQYVLRIKTMAPQDTLRQLHEWLSSKQSERPFQALGISTFGPIDLNEKSKTYGYITTTPKIPWQYTNVVGFFKDLNVPIAFETDVNTPAITEAKEEGYISTAYIGIGTGVGAGFYIGNKPIHGLMHPESGHIKCERFKDDTYPGNCPFHVCCISGMSNARAVADRLNISPEQLSMVSDDDPVWNIQAFYIGQLCSTIICLTSVQRIVIGGGLAKRKCLFELVRRHVQQILNGYINVPTIADHIDKYIVPSKYGDLIGIQAALNLAQTLVERI